MIRAHCRRCSAWQFVIHHFFRATALISPASHQRRRIVRLLQRSRSAARTWWGLKWGCRWPRRVIERSWVGEVACRRLIRRKFSAVRNNRHFRSMRVTYLLSHLISCAISLIDKHMLKCMRTIIILLGKFMRGMFFLCKSSHRASQLIYMAWGVVKFKTSHTCNIYALGW